MLPEVWDPVVDFYTITMVHPNNPTEDQKFYYRQLFENLKYTLP